jgi:uncharacterized protein
VFRIFDVPESVRMQLSVGTSLAVIVPTSIRAYLSHRSRGADLPHVLRIWALPIVVGVVLGSAIAAFAPSTVFKIVFVALLGFVAIKMFSGQRWQLGHALPAPAIMRGYGVFIGLISSLTGTGGGSLATAFLTAYGEAIHEAVGVSAGLGALIAIPGVIGYAIAGWPHEAVMPHFSVGFVWLLGALLIAPISVLTAPYGAQLAHMLSKRNLEIAFGVFALVVSLRFLVSLV